MLRLFTSGTTPRSTGRCEICARSAKTDLQGNYDLEVVDIYQEPGRATESDIIAAPTLIKEEPLPTKRMVGDLSDRPKVLLGLAIAGRSSESYLKSVRAAGTRRASPASSGS